MNWIETEKNLGTVKEHSKVSFTFNSVELLQIKGIAVGCGGCTKVNGYNRATKELYVVYNVGPMSYHLKAQGYQYAKKNITITYKDDTTETLYFKAKIIM